MNAPNVDPLLRDPSSTAPAPRQLGAILIDAGKLTPLEAERVLELQRAKGVRFGDAALKLKLVTRADVERALAEQFDFPYLDRQSAASAEIVIGYKPFSRQAEKLRNLRAELMQRWFAGQPPHKALAIVGVDRRDGRSHLAANLAVAFAQLGERTLLIDADLRCGRQGAIFRLERSSGLSAFLADRIDSTVLQRVRGFPGLSVLPAGPLPPNPQELLSRPRFGALIAEVCRRFDVVLVDTPAARDIADAAVISQRVGGALVVAREHKTRVAAAAAFVTRLSGAGVQVVGSVLNRF